MKTEVHRDRKFTQGQVASKYQHCLPKKKNFGNSDSLPFEGFLCYCENKMSILNYLISYLWNGNNNSCSAIRTLQEIPVNFRLFIKLRNWKTTCCFQFVCNKSRRYVSVNSKRAHSYQLWLSPLFLIKYA